jgi:hypothetical protein
VAHLISLHIVFIPLIRIILWVVCATASLNLIVVVIVHPRTCRRRPPPKLLVRVRPLVGLVLRVLPGGSRRARRPP